MPSAIIRRHHLRANMSAVYHPILTWGRCSHTWGHGRPGCSPTWGHSEARCSPNVAPPPPRARTTEYITPTCFSGQLVQYTHAGSREEAWYKTERPILRLYLPACVVKGRIPVVPSNAQLQLSIIL